jgi:hypothetical protein
LPCSGLKDLEHDGVSQLLWYPATHISNEELNSCQFACLVKYEEKSFFEQRRKKNKMHLQSTALHEDIAISIVTRIDESSPPLPSPQSSWRACRAIISSLERTGRLRLFLLRTICKKRAGSAMIQAKKRDCTRPTIEVCRSAISSLYSIKLCSLTVSANLHWSPDASLSNNFS